MKNITCVLVAVIQTSDVHTYKPYTHTAWTDNGDSAFSHLIIDDISQNFKR